MAVNYDVTRAELEGLGFVVQCRPTGNFNRNWESIAAFNSETIAKSYAEDCQNDNRRHYNYRLLSLSKIQPTFAIVWEA